MSSITEHLVMEDMLHNLCLLFCFGKRQIALRYQLVAENERPFLHAL